MKSIVSPNVCRYNSFPDIFDIRCNCNKFDFSVIKDLEQAKAEIRRLRKIAVDFQEQLRSIIFWFQFWLKSEYKFRFVICYR